MGFRGLTARRSPRTGRGVTRRVHVKQAFYNRYP
jgi:hypothetical protein